MQLVVDQPTSPLPPEPGSKQLVAFLVDEQLSWQTPTAAALKNLRKINVRHDDFACSIPMVGTPEKAKTLVLQRHWAIGRR